MTADNIGAIIPFGNYHWRVLDRQGDAVLLMTEHIIEQRPYHDAYQDVTWENCALRKYLNDTFYHTFTADEQSRIIPTLNKNLDNQWYGTAGGASTQDNIFLLSIEEVVCRYFGDSSEKLYQPRKNQRYWFERKDVNNSKRVAGIKGYDGLCWWWLRSPGRVILISSYVHEDGNIGIQGNNVLKGNIADGWCTGGVRPALWLKLST